MESINKNNFVEIPTECSNPVSLVQHNVQQRHRFNSKQKHPFMLSLETLFSLVHQNKPKMFPSSFFSLPSTLPSPSYCLLFLNAFYTRFGFFVRLIPTNRGSCTHITVSHLAITPHMENEREEQTDRQS